MILSSAQSKFNLTSAYFNGTDAYLSIPDSDNFIFGSDDFTLESWVRFDSVSSIVPIMMHYEDVDNRLGIQLHNTDGLSFVYEEGGTKLIDIKQGSISGWSSNVWYHIAVVRSGNIYNLYRDGSSVANDTNSTIINDIVGDFMIGFDVQYASYLAGYVDEFRITKGIARWTANFTPPTTPYPDYM